jgi:hypothetical protein
MNRGNEQLFHNQQPELSQNPAELEIQRSIDVLKAISSAEWFAQNSEDETLIQIYVRGSEGALHPTSEHISVAEFLMAVDYYIANRDSETLVNFAMQTPNGEVKVWAKSESGQLEKALSVPNYKVSQILEFAYQLARQNTNRIE